MEVRVLAEDADLGTVTWMATAMAKLLPYVELS
jgi:hypothetical protein